jgi:hypothetical protein
VASTSTTVTLATSLASPQPPNALQFPDSSVAQQPPPDAPITLQTPTLDQPVTVEMPSSDPPSIVLQELPTAEIETVDLTQPGESQTVDKAVKDTVNYCNSNSVLDYVEILRCFQQKVVTGRVLEVENVAEAVAGETNYIHVDRNNLIETAFEEIMFLNDYRKTLEVQFYGEVRKREVLISRQIITVQSLAQPVVLLILPCIK